MSEYVFNLYIGYHLFKHMLLSVKQRYLTVMQDLCFDLIFWHYSSYVARINELYGFDAYALVSCAMIVQLLAFICISMN